MNSVAGNNKNSDEQSVEPSLSVWVGVDAKLFVSGNYNKLLDKEEKKSTIEHEPLLKSDKLSCEAKGGLKGSDHVLIEIDAGENTDKNYLSPLQDILCTIGTKSNSKLSNDENNEVKRNMRNNT